MNSCANVRLSICTLFTVIFIDAVGWGVVFPIFTPLILNNATHLLPAGVTLNTRYLTYEWLIALYCFCMFICSPILGALSDNYGRKIILTVSMFGSALGFGVSAMGVVINSLGLIVIGRVVSGMTAGSLSIAQAAMADVSTELEKPKRLAYVGIANGLGFTFGPLLGGYTQSLDHHPAIGNSLAFLISALLAVLGGLFILNYFKETSFKKTLHSITVTTSFKNICNAFTHVSSRIYVLCFFISMTGYILFFNIIPLFLKNEFNSTGIEVGYLLSYFSIVYALSLWILLPALLKYFQLRTLVQISLVVQIVFYGMFAITPTYNDLFLSVLPVAVASPILYVAIIALISNRTDIAEQGKMMGVMGSVTALTWGLGPLLVGVVSKYDLQYCFYFSILFLMAGLLIISKRENVV